MSDNEEPTLAMKRVSFSFDHHKQTLKTESAEVYNVLKTMSWKRAKQAVFASDKGLQELTDSFSPTGNNLKSSLLFSLFVGTICFSVAVAVMWLLEAENKAIKWSLSMIALVFGFLVSLVYFLYFQKRSKLEKAVEDLC